MAVFESKPQLYQVLVGFFEYLAKHEAVGPKLMSSKLTLRFNYKDPEACILIDLSGEKASITADDSTTKVDIEMSMKADTAHKFWKGEVNLVTALARREITAKGPIPKILKLLPIIKPAYGLYPSYLNDIGFEQAAS